MDSAARSLRPALNIPVDGPPSTLPYPLATSPLPHTSQRASGFLPQHPCFLLLFVSAPAAGPARQPARRLSDYPISQHVLPSSRPLAPSAPFLSLYGSGLGQSPAQGLRGHGAGTTICFIAYRRESHPPSPKSHNPSPGQRTQPQVSGPQAVTLGHDLSSHIWSARLSSDHGTEPGAWS